MPGDDDAPTKVVAPPPEPPVNRTSDNALFASAVNQRVEVASLGFRAHHDVPNLVSGGELSTARY